MTSRNIEASDTDLAGQAAPVVSSDLDDVQTPEAEISLEEKGDRADVADVVEQHREVPADEDDYDR